MGRLADAFDALRVRVVSPDHRIAGVLHARNHMEITFLDDHAYAAYDGESRLAAQVTAVIRGLLEGQRQGEKVAITKLTDLTTVTEPHWDANIRAYRTARDSIVATGVSASDNVLVATKGMRGVKVTVKPGTLSRLDEGGFVSEVHSAIDGMSRSYTAQLYELKSKHF
jgi:hypothetical protein